MNLKLSVRKEATIQNRLAVKHNKGALLWPRINTDDNAVQFFRLPLCGLPLISLLAAAL